MKEITTPRYSRPMTTNRTMRRLRTKKTRSILIRFVQKIYWPWRIADPRKNNFPPWIMHPFATNHFAKRFITHQRTWQLSARLMLSVCASNSMACQYEASIALLQSRNGRIVASRCIAWMSLKGWDTRPPRQFRVRRCLLS